MSTDLGKILVFLGIFLVVAGALLLAGGKLPWIGRLPGDITIRRNGSVFHAPLATSLLLSIVASVVLSVIVALFRR